MILVAGGLFLFAQCKKPEEPDRGPNWYQKEAIYDFDLEAGGLVKEHYTQLISRLDEGEVIRMYERLQDTSGWNYHRLFRIITDEWYRSATGLYVSYTTSCSMGLLAPTPRTYLFAPAYPAAGQELPLYQCSDTPYAYNRVATVNEVLTVPAGRFPIFSILHHNGDRSWWSPEVGIVQYETDLRLDTSNTYIRVTLKLSNITAL